MSDTEPFSALHADIDHAPSPLLAAVSASCRGDEREAVQWLLTQFTPDTRSKETIRTLARKLVLAVREKRSRSSGIDALMHEFSLSSDEGVALMCMAEALLRIPDAATADRLIADKIGKGDWRRHLGESPSLFVNAAAWGLLVTGRLVAHNSEQGLSSALTRLIARGGEPLIRKGVDLAMRMLGRQFVIGETIDEALERSSDMEARGYRYSYDMLGEAALTDEDAQRYFSAYENAIHAIGIAAGKRGVRQGPGISVKLSALHPRYACAQRARVMEELLPRLKQLLMLAKLYDVGLNIDAEEADRLEISLSLIEALVQDKALAGFEGMGIVVQAYQKRCPQVIDYLKDLARRTGRRFMVRLVKGAYWDTEIKRAQVDGLSSYPVYTRKVYTDVSYLVCARKLLDAVDVIYPQFATHNAHTLAAVHTWASARGISDYEFQCLHGMGETLYDQVVGAGQLNVPCRIYAPVGSHQTLLAYLVRRLLENGANTSFVNRIVDEDVSVDELIADPFDLAARLGGLPHPQIPLPADLFSPERKNSSGIDWSNEHALRELDTALSAYAGQQWQATALPSPPAETRSDMRPVRNPANRNDVVGHVMDADADQLEHALRAACAATDTWQECTIARRAELLERAAGLFEQNQAELMVLAVREAGKTLPNALGEVREAVDFLRYYAVRAREEEEGRALGVVTCISPWNFPLAIFVGQVAAALAAGNVVLAKPAEQTSLTAFRAVQLLHQAGIPEDVLQFLPGDGETLGAGLIADRRIDGVVFTGSTDVARQIHRRLAARSAAEQREIALIAETGGQNAMIVDSSALPEQVVQDAVVSAFDSAGQRCSALRVLCLQNDIADHILHMLKGAMRELRIGNPDRLSTDTGPVIDEEARRSLLAHVDAMKGQGRAVFELPLPPSCAPGSFVPPTVIEISSLSELKREVFGPVLHVLRYRREELPQLIEAINATGYGLTLGIHSRIDETVEFITSRAHVGNIYVNRNMIGAVVGVQPFGGEGLSGTGPKAGGPLYVKRLRQDAKAFPDTPPQAAFPAFDDLMAWASRQGEKELLAFGAYCRRQSLWNTSLDLPGPTGEQNRLRFTGKGSILCAALTTETLMHQFVACLATGNRLAVPLSSSGLLPAELPAEIRVQVLDDTALKSGELHGALIETALAGEVLPLLAARDGPLVPAILMTEGQQLPLWRLVAERSLCVNTTAAGGNARLMSLDT